jgi:hypothetical protein
VTGGAALPHAPDITWCSGGGLQLRWDTRRDTTIEASQKQG